MASGAACPLVSLCDTYRLAGEGTRAGRTVELVDHLGDQLVHLVQQFSRGLSGLRPLPLELVVLRTQSADFFSQCVALLLRRRREPVCPFRLGAHPGDLLAHLRILALRGFGGGALPGAFLADLPRDHLEHVPHLVDPLRQGFLALHAGGRDRLVHWAPPCRRRLFGYRKIGEGVAAIAASIASFAAKPQNETLEGVPVRDTVDIRTLTHWTPVLARAIHRSLSSSLELQIDSLQTLEIRAEFRRLVPQPGGFSLAHHALSLARRQVGLTRHQLGLTRHQLGLTRHEFGERSMPRPSVRCPLAVRVLSEEPLKGKLSRSV